MINLMTRLSDSNKMDFSAKKKNNGFCMKNDKFYHKLAGNLTRSDSNNKYFLSSQVITNK